MSVTIYGAGGFGINILTKLPKFVTEEGYSEFVRCGIDTSKSNLHENLKEEETYLVEGTDGNGKKRNNNTELLMESVNDILLNHKPGDFNIVVHSASGGTGSVIGPLLVNELIKRDALVFNVVIGSTSSRIETENTLKTLKGYELTAKNTKKPIVTYYKENNLNTPRGEIDSHVVTTLTLLSIVLSGQNRELDKTDIENFLHYTNVTEFVPKLVNMDFFSGSIDVKKGENVFTALTLTSKDGPTEIDGLVEYHALGYIPFNLEESYEGNLPIHLATIDGFFFKYVNGLQDKLKAFNEARVTVVDKSIVGEGDESATGNLIL